MNLESIKRIAVQLEMPDVPEVLESRLKQLSCEQTRIAIVGGDNVGKTTLINGLVGTNLEVSSLPTSKTMRITLKGEEDADSTGAESEWLKEKNIEIWELSGQNLGKEPTLAEYGVHFICADVCVMLLNSVSALSRTEIGQLDILEQLGIPTLLILSKADLLKECDFLEVKKYVTQNICKYNSVKILDTEVGMPINKQVSKVRKVIDELLDETDPKVTSRASLTCLFETEALVALFEACHKKMEIVNKTKAKVETIANEKKLKISDSTTVWLQLQADLSQRKNETARKIKDVFEKRKSETIRQLSHNVEMCSDVKLYWEKELPYRLEDVMKANSQAASQIINVDVMDTINWLNTEIKKSFYRNINSIHPITCTIEPETFKPTEHPDIADNRKIRIVARVGTAATVIAAGTMFATMGIGGIVMATGMVAGIGAEFFMNRKQSESKERVQSLIPQMVEQAQQKLSVNISDSLNNSYDELIKNLQSYQESWIEDAMLNIEKELKIALFNCKSDEERLNQCMQEINKLSEEVQNYKIA